MPEVVPYANGDDLLDQVPVHVLKLHQFGRQAVHGLGARLDSQELCPGAGVVEHVGADWMPFGMA